MNYLLVCWLLVALCHVEDALSICWDTGCQLDSWAVRGCQQYGMLETGQKPCPSGIVYSCCDQNQTSAASLTSRPKCWDTGCQLDSWAIRGCQQYGMIETGQKSCPNGIVFSCCEESHTSASTNRGRPKCWDTGCQLDSWAVRGCQQYGMVETGQKSCHDGIVYSCCESHIQSNATSSHRNSNTDTSSNVDIRSTTASFKAKPKCWDTGCQLDSWLVRGCDQYDMVEVGQKWCDGGRVYSCCDKNVANVVASAPNSKPKCWDTGCQLDSWAVRGCQQYGMVKTGQKTCPNGIIYSCCGTHPTSHNISSANEIHTGNNDIGDHTSNEISHKISNDDHSSTTTLKAKPRCWDTGCQLDSWLVRGCEQYNMVEVGQKWCDGGRVYSCCDKNATKPAALAQPPKPKCWETGCQLDSWAVRGCEQYHMVEIGQHPCHQGIVYSCCEKNSTTVPVVESTSAGSESTATPQVIIITPSTPASKPKCWDTGCQLNSWAVRGCEQYDMIETGQQSCPNGIIYSCCHKNGTSGVTAAGVVAAAKPKCWDTGCQLDSWAIRGCQQYGMVETGQKQCPNGIVYSCCENNDTISTKQSKPKCWDTGCQLDSWAVRGCEQYDMLEVGQKSCPDGIVYSCCDKNVTTAPPPKVEHKCWDTGCQLNSWAVRGCEQYDMEEVDQKECDNGIVYSCCHKNKTAPAVRQAPKKCWDTGCQLDVWKSRGCEQYGMIEKSQRSCSNGIVFTCCRP